MIENGIITAEVEKIISDILKHGSEVIIRIRSKNGEKYLEIVEQKLTVKCKV